MTYFAHARTALKYGLKNLGFKKGDRILVPDYVCAAVLHPIKELFLEVVYYPINDSFEPEWESLEGLVKNNTCRAIIMVHYFGQPQNIARFKDFCSLHNMLLLEDNAHGCGGYLNGKLLGTFGDIGICSPRKFIGTPSGGVLYNNDSKTLDIMTELKSFPVWQLKIIIKIVINFIRPVKRIIQSWIAKSKNWSDPFLYKESIKPDYKIDFVSRWLIESTNWPELAKRRRDNWMAWEMYIENTDLIPIFDTVYSESCPWVMPAYANSIEERNSWLRWGADNNAALFPWPSLPEAVVNSEGVALERWKLTICFPLDISPDELGL